MQRITIERFKPVPTDVEIEDDETGISRHTVPLTDEFAGCIEGLRDDGTGWIIYIDGAGSPLVFFSQREADGAVIGDPISLQPELEVSVSVSAE